MNIYTILLGKDKCETFFPRLPEHQEKTKKLAKKKNKDRNNSLDEKKYRVTQHEIMKDPLPSFKKIEQNQVTTLRKTFLKKNFEDKKENGRIGSYKFIQEIGKGGFAEVFEAENEKGQVFAIKQYNLQTAYECFHNQYIVGQHFFDKSGVKKQFMNENGTGNLIKFVEKMKYGKKGYIVQERSGRSLSKLLSEIQGVFYKNERVYEVQFSEFYHQLAKNNNLAKMLKQIAEGIKMLNEEGFLHCDLKPENILVEGSEQIKCKIIDFGSAFERGNGLPKITITPEYMPPQLLYSLDSDTLESRLSKVDVWSFGCVLLEILTGIPLWFRYKCKLVQKGRTVLQLGIFALTNREYHKIMKRQKQLCQHLDKINFTLPQFQRYRGLLKRILVYREEQRASMSEIINYLQSMV